MEKENTTEKPMWYKPQIKCGGGWYRYWNDMFYCGRCENKWKALTPRPICKNQPKMKYK